MYLLKYIAQLLLWIKKKINFRCRPINYHRMGGSCIMIPKTSPVVFHWKTFSSVVHYSDNVVYLRTKPPVPPPSSTAAFISSAASVFPTVTNWRNYRSIFAEGLLKEDTIWRMSRSWGARLRWLSLSLITTCSDLLSALCSLRGEKQTRGRDATDLTTVFHSVTVPLLFLENVAFPETSYFTDEQ